MKHFTASILIIFNHFRSSACDRIVFFGNGSELTTKKVLTNELTSHIHAMDNNHDTEIIMSGINCDDDRGGGGGGGSGGRTALESVMNVN